MSEILLPPPSPTELYAPDLSAATQNFTNGVYENGERDGSLANQDQQTGQTLIEFPFEKGHSGDFVDHTPTERQIDTTADISALRERFSHEGLLGVNELGVFLYHSTQFANSAVHSEIPNFHEFGDVFKKYSEEAYRVSIINSQTGSNDISVSFHPEIEGDTINLDVHRLDQVAGLLAEQPGVEWRNKGDTRLFSYLSSFVHEHGHSVARKFAENANPPGKYSNSFFASYLSAHPNEGYTGLLGSDPNIYDERYANGLAALTIKHVATYLGYSEAEQGIMLKNLMPLEQEYSNGEHHQIEAVEHARTTNSSIGKAALELAGVQSDHLAYEGGLGYKRFLTAEELGEVFYFAKEVTVDGVPATILNAVDYRNFFDAQYDGNVHPHVAERLASVRAN